MSEIKLNYSPVIFDPEPHTYTTPEGKLLSGVTSILSRRLFTNKYSGISKTVLNRAAEKGTMVHEAIEAFETFGIDSDMPQLSDYKKLCNENNLEVLETEYLVSDNKNVASKIDILCKDLTLVDIKTTSKLDREYLSWQLSLYAFLFELQNPHLRVKRLASIWLPDKRYGKACFSEVERKLDSEVQNLIVCDSLDLPYTSLPETTKDNVPISAKAIEEVCRIEREMKVAKARYEELKNGLMALMQDYGVKSFSNDLLSLSLKDAYTSEKFDSKAFKEEYPELYKQFVKSSNVSASLTIRVK